MSNDVGGRGGMISAGGAGWYQCKKAHWPHLTSFDIIWHHFSGLVTSFDIILTSFGPNDVKNGQNDVKMMSNDVTRRENDIKWHQWAFLHPHPLALTSDLPTLPFPPSGAHKIFFRGDSRFADFVEVPELRGGGAGSRALLCMADPSKRSKKWQKPNFPLTSFMCTSKYWFW